MCILRDFLIKALQRNYKNIKSHENKQPQVPLNDLRYIKWGNILAKQKLLLLESGQILSFSFWSTVLKEHALVHRCCTLSFKICTG